jgi:chemotaxis protein methyltransferase CheR
MLTESEFNYVAREVKARSGALLSREMCGPAANRLAPLARREGFATVSEFLAAARVKQDAKLWGVISDALVQTETRFFRDKAHFERLRTDILPDLFARRAGAPLQIWSAGCGTGQEAYSLAMMMEEFRAEGAPGAEILATDMSERLLDKARAGLYTQFEVQRGLPIRKLISHFEKLGDLWRIADRLRAGVRFEQHNLMQDATALGRFDIVLCRHVLSCFDAHTRAATLERVAATMAPDGVLLLGAGEGADAEAFIASSEPGVFVRNAAWRRAA